MTIDLIKRLYFKEGLSCKEISIKTNKSIWQIIYLLRKNKLKLRTPAETQKIQFLKSPLSFRERSPLSPRDKLLHQAGLMLYWAEGNKTYNTVDLANSDEKMILLFLKMLRNIYRVDEKRLRVLVYCYANQNYQQLIKYWMKKLNLPKDQFIKPFVRRDFQKDKINKMPHGLVHIRYNDKRLLMKIMDEIGIIANNLILC
jgi:hypothetical protein